MNTSQLLALDKRYVWHPFTQMREWLEAKDPVVIIEGQGALLRDSEGHEYLDGNASIWTNLHGHRHPSIDSAIRNQLDKIAHSSFLGLTNELAPQVAEKLVLELDPQANYRVFFSDDGSTAMEAALKMAYQARKQRDEKQRKKFVSLDGGYHGDTIGAMSLGQSPLFHSIYRPLMFESRKVLSPGCYRCPYNRALPEKGVEARTNRQCEWECIKELETVFEKEGQEITALVMEPRVQGAAGMVMQPNGYLKKVSELCRENGVWLILDEVMTGFARTGRMFACQWEEVKPDLMALAKGLTTGYLPLAATLANETVFEAFLGDYQDFKTFFHGHSYTGNALGCAVALANLEVFKQENTLEQIAQKSVVLAEAAQCFWEHPNVGDVRQEGMILAIEAVEDFLTKKPFPMANRTGFQICETARKYGLLTRPIGDVLILMPPYCATTQQLKQMVEILYRALIETLIGK